MARIKNAGLAIISMFLAVQVYGQVTIGGPSDPRPGALLDLTQGEVTTKGLVLPRVNLKSLTAIDNDLRTTIDGLDVSAGTPWGVSEHEGLTVYNLNEVNCTDLFPGVYVWTGNRWKPLTKSGIHSDALYQPNSYMVSPGTTKVEIPVMKAFAIWEYYGWDQVGRLPAETISGTLSASLYWQDAPIVNGVTVSGNTRNDKITVSLSGGAVEGNAVVALKDGNGVIRWSWHIWVTDSPVDANLVANGLQWMDRFLGATSSTPGDPNAIGLYYQWGRKDPFPGYADFQGGIKTISGEVNAVDLNSVPVSNRQENLRRSIVNPVAFIKVFDRSSDWYSDSRTVTDPVTRWDGRWSKSECGVSEKTPFDPCPEGWKVPGYEDNNNQIPWQGIDSYTGSQYWNTGEYGYTWTVARGVNPSVGDFGYYPATGYRSGGNGALISEIEGNVVYGVNGYSWSATSFVDSRSNYIARSLHYTGANRFDVPKIHTWGYDASPAAAYPVRCVKIKE